MQKLDFKFLINNYGLTLSKLKTLYDEMDEQYTSVAAYYGFECRGCEDNCCLTRFYHHTVLEMLYLYQGFDSLSQDRQAEIIHRANQVWSITQESEQAGNHLIRVMCPLNENHQCMLYAFRPMICRLHGIPHEVHMQHTGVQYGPGCHVFHEKIKNKPYLPFDRTKLYAKMASLEGNFRKSAGITEKYKMTVAQILINFN